MHKSIREVIYKIYRYQKILEEEIYNHHDCVSFLFYKIIENSLVMIYNYD